VVDVGEGEVVSDAISFHVAPSNTILLESLDRLGVDRHDFLY